MRTLVLVCSIGQPSITLWFWSSTYASDNLLNGLVVGAAVVVVTGRSIFDGCTIIQFNTKSLQ